MLYEELKELSAVRLEHAEECLKAAEDLIDTGNYRSSANRSYYSVFHAMRSVLAFDQIDMKKHSGVISEFRRLYIKTGIFPAELSNIISDLLTIRTDSDYDDFYIVSKDEVVEQYSNAGKFLDYVKKYLKTK